MAGNTTSKVPLGAFWHAVQYVILYVRIGGERRGAGASLKMPHPVAKKRCSKTCPGPVHKHSIFPQRASYW